MEDQPSKDDFLKTMYMTSEFEVERLRQENAKLKESLQQQAELVAQRNQWLNNALSKEKVVKTLDELGNQHFCPECGKVMKTASHYCRECNSSVAVPFELHPDIIFFLKRDCGVEMK